MPFVVSSSTYTLEAAYTLREAIRAWPDVTSIEKPIGRVLFDTLIIPLVAAIASLCILLLQGVATWIVTLFWPNAREAHFENEQVSESHHNLRAEVRRFVERRGGSIIVWCRVTRVLGGLVLLTLTLIVAPNQRASENIPLNQDGDWSDNSHNSVQRRHLIDLSFGAVYLYTTVLSLLAIFASKRWSLVARWHVNLVYLLTFVVFVYRDLYPLTTFNKRPLDIAEGTLLWIKITVLFAVGILMPLITPRQYTPFDSNNPMEPNPEQTASFLSMVTFSFLDPIVSLACRVPHLAHDQLPALADYDYAHNLKLKSFKYLDVFAKAKESHIGWRLLRVFRFEYTLMGILVALLGLSTFVSPFAINRLLSYLEGERVATVQPWVWIVCLFMGPFVTSMFFQGYIFFATRTLVRCEAIITQLVFEHSLRIRMKAETEKVEREVSSTELPTSQMERSSENRASSATSAVEEEGNSQNTTLVSNVPASISEGSVLAKSPSIKSTSPKSTTGNKEDLRQNGAPTGSSSASNLVGHINNLVTTDLGNIVDARDLMFVLVFIPLQIIACIAFLYWILGWSAFVGLIVMILLFPFPGYVAKRIQVVQEGRLKKTDARVQTVTEAMNMLRMIKLFGWETKMQDRISVKREDELVWLWKRQLLDLVNGNINFIIPVLVMVSTYLTYEFSFLEICTAQCLKFSTVFMKQELKPSIVFSSMTVFDLLRDQLFIGFYMVNALISGKVSLDRVNDFLKNTELLDAYAGKDHALFIGQPRAGDERIGFNEASFAWSAESDGSLTPSKRRYLLKIEHELLFKPKRFNVIVGPTGSGKTSILMALLGEMHYLPNGSNSWFNLPRQNGVAYAAQESWILNETIKENILFGSPYERERYQKVLHQCGLERDLDLFEAGDETEVGEKGLTVSGGQKARITLARAIYSPAQIILLDDVLAALDVHTAKWVVDKCFSGDLVKGRTVILVTHNIAMIRSLADFAVSIGTDGRVIAQGTILEVVGIDKSVSKELQRNEEEIEMAEEELDKADEPALPKSGGKLIVAEEIEEGHISWKSVKLFFIGLGGDHPALFFVAFLGGLFVVEFINAFQTWFLGYWASQYERRPASDVSVFYYLGTYVALMALAVTMYLVAFVVFIYGVLRASRQLHRKLVESVLGTTLRWLDTTPASRIITRCTQDIRALDGPLKEGLRNLTEITMGMLMRLGAVVVMTPLFLLPGFFVGLFGGWVGRIYMAAQLSVKREMSNAKAPVVGHFGASIAGLTSIRAYGAQEAFIKLSMDRINRYTRAARVFYNLNRWVCIRIDTISGLFAAGLGIHLVYFQDQTTANIGFSLNMAVGFSGMILWWIRMLNEFEVQGNSLERIQGYLTIEQEPKPTARGVPPAYWPASGSLVVQNLSAKYSQDGPKVLQDISFEVKSGERVGIVGRTGSGKSSLTLALLRCIPTDGDVFYDGVKTSDINLDSLRSTVTIIPQIPELLSGSLRHNLDPFDQYDDATLNDALRAAGLSELQFEMDDDRITLDTQVSSGGGNLSVGQRQILALARAIVRGSKLLILDEATSAIDHKTDNAIQSSLRHELGHDTTVITIAHRLQTIMDGDKVMVLDAGRIVEYDSPANLLKNKNGFLHSLVEESGDKQHLYEMANAKHSLRS